MKQYRKNLWQLRREWCRAMAIKQAAGNNRPAVPQKPDKKPDPDP